MRTGASKQRDHWARSQVVFAAKTTAPLRGRNEPEGKDCDVASSGNADRSDVLMLSPPVFDVSYRDA